MNRAVMLVVFVAVTQLVLALIQPYAALAQDIQVTGMVTHLTTGVRFQGCMSKSADNNGTATDIDASSAFSSRQCKIIILLYGYKEQQVEVNGQSIKRCTGNRCDNGR